MLKPYPARFPNMRYSIALLLVSLISVNSLTRETFNRRDAISSAAFGVAGGLLSQVQPTYAAAVPPTKAELDRIVLGYKQISALLDNFEEATTTCRENGGECKRDAEPIRESATDCHHDKSWMNRTLGERVQSFKYYRARRA